MAEKRGGRKLLVVLTLVVLAVGAGGLAYWVVSRHADVPLPESNTRTVETVDSPDPFSFLPEQVAKEIEADLGKLLNVSDAGNAVVSIRQRIVELNRKKTSYTHAVIAVTVDGIARRFGQMDKVTRQACFYLLSEAFSWFERNEAPTWPRLLAPAEQVVREQLATTAPENRVQALNFIRVYWEWLPAGAELGEAERQLIAEWKASLHEAATELLHAPDAEVREAAIRAVAAAPIDEAARDALVGLEDPEPQIRRATLLALAERPEILTNERVLPLLNDRDYDVRTTARVVLSCRGVSQEAISLATMAFHPLPLTRIQAARHIAMSQAVDRVVWLGYLLKDEDPEVRAEAARGLAFVGTPAALAKLREVAQKAEDAELKALAQQLLAEAGSPVDHGVRQAAHDRRR